ncbi:MAG: MmcQ/YjbR family DNA-binding protein [Acidimicrobiia bacterium]|nr:MmcQ/YjbR family DNA-binding protein [Acidimicrobiia bacterium]
MTSGKKTPPELWAERLRAICLDYPEATEQETWGHPTFRVNDKIFAGMGTDDDGLTAMSMKAEPGAQGGLLDEGHPFFYPKYVGSKGWIGVVVDGQTDWDRIADLVDDSYRAIAPKKLVKLLDESRSRESQ